MRTIKGMIGIIALIFFPFWNGSGYILQELGLSLEWRMKVLNWALTHVCQWPFKLVQMAVVQYI